MAPSSSHLTRSRTLSSSEDPELFLEQQGVYGDTTTGTMNEMLLTIPDNLPCDGCRNKTKNSKKKTKPATFKCGRCRCAYYCSPQCQARDWNQHREHCVDFLELAAAQLQVLPREILLEDDKECGLCQKEGAPDSIVCAPCGHVFCWICLARHVHTERQQENEDDGTVLVLPCDSQCHCPVCSVEILAPGAHGVEDIPMQLAERYAKVASRLRAMTTTSDNDEAETYEKAAVREWGRVVRGYQLTREYAEAQDVAERLALVVPLETYFDAWLRKAELELKVNPQKSADDLDGWFKKEKKLLEHDLQLELGECTNADPSGGKQRLQDLLGSISTKGFDIREYAWRDGNEALRQRSVRVIMASIKVFIALEHWEAVIQGYGNILPYFTTEQKMLILADLAKCAWKLGENDKALFFAMDITKSLPGRRAPGNHRLLASVLESTGDFEAGMEVMRRGLVYEAPWDDANKALNRDMYLQLSNELSVQVELRRKEEAFLSVWGQVLDIVTRKRKQADAPISWQTIKEKDYDMLAGDSDDEGDDDEFSGHIGEEETARKVQAATAAALSAPADETEHSEGAWSAAPVVCEASDAVDYETGPEESCEVVYENIKMTKSARKNFDSLDTTLRDFVSRKLDDLAHGRGGKTTRKELVGCKNVRIFETYVEQSLAGHRILWTQLDDSNICIWYIPTHKKVPKMMKKIDEADELSTRRLTNATVMLKGGTSLDVDAQHKMIGEDRVFLDPFSDTPLKVYDIPRDDIVKLNSPKWKPRLHLTKQEREIVDSDSTVLLLGRSGTGKTVCICERLARDRHHADSSIEFSQLFVARSKRICDIVSDLVGAEYNEENEHLRRLEYLTFGRLVNKCMDKLPGVHPRAFDRESKVGFLRFKRDFEPVYKNCDVEALVLWTQFRSFIKGSVEALLKEDSVKRLTLEEYLDLNVFGTSRCRLPLEQRRIAYDAFLKYEAEMDRMNLWDDCDLIAAVHSKFDESKNNGTFPDELLFDKLYVDEIQDYTQSEIALFIKLCKPGNWFFAGDAAQAVVEGVEFRFEEIRSVVYKLMREEDRNDRVRRQKIIPQKPKKVTVNFRSHSGILNVAAEVLDVMFGAFPYSAPDLGKDCGVFQGPRPGFFENISEEKLKELVSKIEGVHVLTRLDSDVERLQELLGDQVFVLSIRDSKGLEFTDVILVDFFKGLHRDHQKPWREMLRVVKDQDKAIDLKAYQDEYPEIETHLKQLYTAVTRCKTRFFIAETGPSLAGAMFAKWLINREEKLISRQNVDAVKKILKTTDQWVTQGMDYAKKAENEADFEQATKHLGRAAICFENAEESELQKKVMHHLESLRLRRKIYYKYHEDKLVDDDEERSFEEVAVATMANLAGDDLLTETNRFCRAVMPLLEDYTRQSLEERLRPMLPEVYDDE